MPTVVSSSPVTNTYLTVGVLCTAITYEGSGMLPKRLQIVNNLTIVNEPQSYPLLYYIRQGFIC